MKAEVGHQRMTDDGALFTKSELVVLIRRGEVILGQIGVDSDVPDPFTAAEQAEVKKVADALAVLL